MTLSAASLPHRFNVRSFSGKFIMKIKLILFVSTLAITSLLIYPTRACDEFGESKSAHYMLGVPTQGDSNGQLSKEVILRKAIADCQQFIDFEEEFEEKQPMHVDDPEDNKGNIEGTKNIKKCLEECLENCGEDSILEKLLSSLLDIRLIRLSYRKQQKVVFDKRYKDYEENLKITHYANSINKPFYGYTDPTRFNSLCPEAKFFAQCSTDRYQFTNRYPVEEPPKVFVLS